MYLVTIHVPIYLRGRECWLATEWKRALTLLRDSFSGRFGRIQVVAPTLDAYTTPPDQPLERLAASDEIDLHPSFPLDTRARDFWRKYLRVWKRDVSAFLPKAAVVHTGLSDVYRPLDFVGFLTAIAAHKPTVFVQDTDLVLQDSALTARSPLRERVASRAYCGLYERSVRYAVRHAALSLFKGRAVEARYGRFARNAKNFQDTYHLSREIVSLMRVEHRGAELARGERPLRLVYCGRLEAKKGLDESIDAVMRARSRGANLTLDILGDGKERAALERQATHWGAGDTIRFHAARAYGPELLTHLSHYDALLFTPVAEDTPRMIFDGYAAGLPVIGYGIAYLREREVEDGAARCVSVGDSGAAASLLCALDRDRRQLAELSRRAHTAAQYHAADAWYQRRAEWTYEAAAARGAAPGPS